MDDSIIFMDEQTSSLLYLKTTGTYDEGNYTYYHIKVSTKGFSGHDTFVISKWVLAEVVAKIDKLLEFMEGELILPDEGLSYLVFQFEDKLNLYVSGELGGLGDKLTFKMRIDQTALLRLKKALLNR